MNDLVTLSHGSGGKQSGELVERVFRSRFMMSEPLTDSAIIERTDGRLAFTTDSYVVDPIFFPGGDIGKLAVCGTVNDLAVTGAVPRFLSAAFVIEEGFLMKDLETIASSMAEEAARAGVRIVTGDTKVVEKGKCDRIFITTAGTGFIAEDREHISRAVNVMPGDRVIVSGPLGNHAIAILGARKNLSFSTPVVSDCASLNNLTEKILSLSSGVHFMRDLTRGGLAAILNELATITGYGLSINEAEIPVDESVKGLCEILGFDPLSLANEGKIVIVASKKESDEIVRILRADALGCDAAAIGEVTGSGRVVLNTATGGSRLLEMPSGLMLPRIC